MLKLFLSFVQNVAHLKMWLGKQQEIYTLQTIGRIHFLTKILIFQIDQFHDFIQLFTYTLICL